MQIVTVTKYNRVIDIVSADKDTVLMKSIELAEKHAGPLNNYLMESLKDNGHLVATKDTEVCIETFDL